MPVFLSIHLEPSIHLLLTDPNNLNTQFGIRALLMKCLPHSLPSINSLNIYQVLAMLQELRL